MPDVFSEQITWMSENKWTSLMVRFGVRSDGDRVWPVAECKGEYYWGGTWSRARAKYRPHITFEYTLFNGVQTLVTGSVTDKDVNYDATKGEASLAGESASLPENPGPTPLMRAAS
jgi:hypothetical protein